MPKSTWSKKQVKKLIKLYNRGDTYPDIAVAVNKSIHAIDHHIRELKVRNIIPKIQPNRRRGHLSNSQEAEAFHYKTLFEQIGKSILRAVNKIPKYKTFKAPKIKIPSSLDEEEWGLLWSDSQIGELVNQKETGGLGNYNYEVFLRRLSFLKEGLIKIKHYHPPVKVFNVFFLGDIIDNATIFLGQMRQVDMKVVSQVILASERIAEFLIFLAAQYEHVNCYCIVGNHGRIGKPGEMSPTDNLEYLIYYIIKQRLSNLRNIRIEIAESWFMVIQRMTSRFFIIHGEDIRSWMTIPFYSAERSEGRWQKLTRAQFDYFIAAHHHQQAEFDNIIFNGSWVGGSEFSIKKLAKSGLPSQTLFSIHPTFGITWRRNVVLVDPKEIKKVPVEIYR
ncbi:MAG: metallophosphoesterase [Candidatus Omnitrophica bacterium]|nr:metallophosphoesterase [Candidatus Omnitrophota bacterium]MDD5592439.1 metallophosphoesterase [Candidatus Omnitrophota bacterium]